MKKKTDKCKHGFRPYIDSGFCAKCHPEMRIKELEGQLLSQQLLNCMPSIGHLTALEDIARLTHNLDIAIMALKAIATEPHEAGRAAKKTLELMVNAKTF